MVKHEKTESYHKQNMETTQDYLLFINLFSDPTYRVKQINFILSCSVVVFIHDQKEIMKRKTNSG